MRRFDPADYPDYSFNPETGTPTRVTRPRRGPFAKHQTRILEPTIRKTDGRECFQIQRVDGVFRVVSRDVIQLAFDPWFVPEPRPLKPASGPPTPGNQEPEPLPPWSFEIEGFAGYALVLDPFSVIRHDNPATGPVVPHIRLKPTVTLHHTHDKTYEYSRFGLISEHDGRRKRLTAEKIMDLAGVTMADIAAAHKRSKGTPTPCPRPPATLPEA